MSAKLNMTITTMGVDGVDDSPIIGDRFNAVFSIITYGFICQGVVILGCITNTVNMVVFFKIGFKDTINISLFGLGLSDFGVCFTLIWLNITKLSWFQALDLPFNPHQIQYLTSTWPHLTCGKITTLITAFIVVERCLCVTSPLKVKTIITRRVVTIVVISSYLVVLCSVIPIYYANRYAWTFDEKRNKSIIGLVFTKDRQQIESLLAPIQNIILALLPFVIICVGTAIFSTSLRSKSVWREKATSGTSASELSTKETKIAKMVVLISTLFIICYFPNIIVNTLVMTHPDMSIGGKEWNLVLTLGSVVFTLECINSALNIFIYYRNSSSYRAMFDQIFQREKKSVN